MVEPNNSPGNVGQNDTRFGDVVSAMAANRNMKLREVAEQVECSPSTLSMIGKGERRLSDTIARGLARVLGGTDAAWKRVFLQTRTGSEHPIEFYRTHLLANDQQLPLQGVRVRRMRKAHILSCLADSIEHRNLSDDKRTFRIDNFEPKRVQETSYDTVLGSVVSESKERQDWQKDHLFRIRAGESVIAYTYEAINLPHWMEADVHPASNLAANHLIVSSGPIIDPGYEGFLKVAVFNPTTKDRFIKSTEAFLTLRFWLQDIEQEAPIA